MYSSRLRRFNCSRQCICSIVADSIVADNVADWTPPLSTIPLSGHISGLLGRPLKLKGGTKKGSSRQGERRKKEVGISTLSSIIQAPHLSRTFYSPNIIHRTFIHHPLSTMPIVNEMQRSAVQLVGRRKDKQRLGWTLLKQSALIIGWWWWWRWWWWW